MDRAHKSHIILIVGNYIENIKNRRWYFIYTDICAQRSFDNKWILFLSTTSVFCLFLLFFSLFLNWILVNYINHNEHKFYFGFKIKCLLVIMRDQMSSNEQHRNERTKIFKTKQNRNSLNSFLARNGTKKKWCSTRNEVQSCGVLTCTNRTVSINKCLLLVDWSRENREEKKPTKKKESTKEFGIHRTSGDGTAANRNYQYTPLRRSIHIFGLTLSVSHTKVYIFIILSNVTITRR